MRKSFDTSSRFLGTALLLALLAQTAPTLADDSWSTATPILYPRYGFAVGAVEHSLFIVDGSGPNSDALTLLEEYNTVTNTRAFRASLPGFARTGLAVGVIDNVLYAVGGFNTMYGYTLGSLDAYNRVTDQWSQRAAMPIGRYDFGVGVINGRLYAAGGNSGGAITNALHVYDPATDTWQGKAAMPTARYGLGVAAVNGVLYAIGGALGNASVATVEAYDPATNTWSTKASMLTARRNFAISVVGDVVYVMGGYNAGVLNSVEAYDPATNIWSPRAPMPTARYNFAAAALSPQIYAVGGNASACCYFALNTVEIYTARLTPPNLPPTAVVGADQTIHAGQPVALDGSASFDDNTDSTLLQYHWTLVSLPTGSMAELLNAGTPQPQVTVDLPGTYVVELVVTDGQELVSAAARVVISSENLPPTADAGVAQAGTVGQSITLTGAASSDPDGDTLTYVWNFMSVPSGSVVALSEANGVSATFTPDQSGQYVVGLVVGDGFTASMPAQVVISVISAADYAQNRLADLLNYLRAMSPEQFKAPGHQRALVALLTQAIAALEAGDFSAVRWKIVRMLTRVDGDPERGNVDGNGPGMDWVVDSIAQSVIYHTLKEAAAALPQSQERYIRAHEHCACDNRRDSDNRHEPSREQRKDKKKERKTERDSRRSR